MERKKKRSSITTRLRQHYGVKAESIEKSMKSLKSKMKRFGNLGFAAWKRALLKLLKSYRNLSTYTTAVRWIYRLMRGTLTPYAFLCELCVLCGKNFVIALCGELLLVKSYART